MCVATVVQIMRHSAHMASHPRLHHSSVHQALVAIKVLTKKRSYLRMTSQSDQLKEAEKYVRSINELS